MPLSDAEKLEISSWARSKACNEFRRGLPCERRDPSTTMIGDMHEGCFRVQQILDVLERA